MARLVYLDLVGVEPDLISDLELSWCFAVPGHFFFASSKHCFGVDSGFLELIQTLVDCGNIASTAGGDSEIRLVAIHDFEW